MLHGVYAHYNIMGWVDVFVPEALYRN